MGTRKEPEREDRLPLSDLFDEVVARESEEWMSIQSVFEEIESNLANLEIDEIKRRLDPVFIGMAVEVPIIDPGTFLYRARKLGGDFRKPSGITRADLIYPPKARTRIGRLNRPNESVFYCSTGKEALFLELQDLKPGDELVLTFWQTTEDVPQRHRLHAIRLR